MAIDVIVHHNDGFLPGIILLTKCYYHRGTRLNAMKRFCICSQLSHLNVLAFSPLTGECPEGLDEFRFFFKHENKNLIVISPTTDGPQRARLPIPHNRVATKVRTYFEMRTDGQRFFV